ncbi:hypothetical protein K438DRAFT_1883667 [Mycena galopus ATCC 62051]|nr:hypothetical protein K438DRAFT_1883667 [Mycena galopus ATCC 62051]
MRPKKTGGYRLRQKAPSMSCRPTETRRELDVLGNKDGAAENDDGREAGGGASHWRWVPGESRWRRG